MNNILVCAMAVSSDAILSPWRPEVTFSPDLDLKDLADRKCCVVPVNTEYKFLSRGLTELTYRVDIGFLFRAKELNMPSLLDDVSSFAPQFIGKEYGGAICVKAVHEPLYDVEGIRTMSKFTAVISLTLREVVNGR